MNNIQPQAGMDHDLLEYKAIVEASDDAIISKSIVKGARVDFSSRNLRNLL